MDTGTLALLGTDGAKQVRVTATDAAGNSSTLTVKEQIDSFLASNTFTNDDLVMVNGGISDVIANMAAVNAGTMTTDQMAALTAPQVSSLTIPQLVAMTTAQSMAVWRAPSRPITRPANITADTAPTAAATSTSESAPSPKE